MARRRARLNPGTTELLIIGAGVAALGVGAYFLFKPQVSTATTGQPTPSNLGDPNDQNSTAYACNTAYHMNVFGHPELATPWITKCTQGGGQVPTSAATQYV